MTSLWNIPKQLNGNTSVEVFDSFVYKLKVVETSKRNFLVDNVLQIKKVSTAQTMSMLSWSNKIENSESFKVMLG